MRLDALAAVILMSGITPLVAQSTPSVRPVGPVTHVSPEGMLRSVTSVRVLPDGRVIVNDLTGRRLLLFERDLSTSSVLADSTVATGRAYSGAFASLIPYRGDSSLFIEPQSMSMAVVNQMGATARVMSIPRPSDAGFLAGGPFGTPGFDSRGRLVYRGMARPSVAPTPTELSQGPTYRQMFPDSAPIYRINLATRMVDTVTWVRIPAFQMARVRDPKGATRGLNVLANPIPVIDAWTVTSDGMIAVVRGADFHIDWIDAAGKVVSTAKIPFNWQRLDDEAKQRIADSARTAADARGEALLRGFERDPSRIPPLADALMRPLGIMTTLNPTSQDGRQRTLGVPQFIPSRLVTPPLSQLPDYSPAFEMGAVVADLNGNVWVRTTAPSDRGPVFYVINGRGELSDRVQLPFGRVIAGFGPGVVYMGVLDEKGARIERALLK